MKQTQKTLLALSIATLSSGAAAELSSIDDESLRDVTGMAGVTIDVEAQWEIGEFMYRDAGALILEGIRMGGNSFSNGTGTAGDFFDNLRIELDIAGDGTNDDNKLAYGFSNMRKEAQLYVDAGNPDPIFAAVAGGIDVTRGNLAIDDKRVYEDGDLVMHFDFTDGWKEEGGFAAYSLAGRFGTDTYAEAEHIFELAVDFRFEIDAIGIADSSFVEGGEIGSANSNLIDAGTTLISDLGIQGYLGPEDLIIENDGNGFGDPALGGVEGPLGAGTGTANSKIIWSQYTMITDMDYYLNIAGVQYKDIQIHNKRGDLSGLDGTSSFGFSHSIIEIYAVKDAVLNLDRYIRLGSNNIADAYVDGIAINIDFKGDMDIGHLSFGDTDESIGSFYYTDIISYTNLVISAH